MDQQRAGAGLGAAVLSAATFGTSGAFARSLLDAGWSPAAAVTARVAIAAAVLAVPAALSLRGRRHVLRQSWAMVVAFGLVAVAGCQLFYFQAVEHLSVGVALLLEYSGTILVVGWLWLRHGHRPRRLTVAGSAVAALGLVLVLDLAGSHRLDPVGVLWGLAAACGLAVYFVLSSRSDTEVPPVLLAGGGMAVGAVVLAVLGGLGVLRMDASTAPVEFVGHRTSWLVPILGLSLVAAVVAYLLGIGAARLLGAKLAGFVGLTEVVFAVLFAWLLLDQVPTGVQLAGGSLIVGGIALVRLDELRSAGYEFRTDAAEGELDGALATNMGV